MTAGAFLCVLRARFFRFEVRLFGTAMVVESCWWLESGGRGMRGENLSRGDVELLQRVPPRVGRFRRAFVRPGVEIGPAARAEPLAVWATEREGWCGEQPLLTERGAKVELDRRAFVHVHVRFVRVFASLLREDDVRFLVYVSRGVSQTAAAFEDDVAVQVDMPIETALAGRRDSASDPHAIDGLSITFFPHRIVGRQHVVDNRGVCFEGSNVD